MSNQTRNPTRDPTRDSTLDQPSKPVTTLEDTMLIAYLKLKGHTAIPWISRDDPDDPRVSFDIEGDETQIEVDIQAFYSEAEQVSIQALSRAYKEVKSAMYSMKRIGKK